MKELFQIAAYPLITLLLVANTAVVDRLVYRLIKRMLGPGLCIDINTYSDRKSKYYVKFV